MVFSSTRSAKEYESSLLQIISPSIYSSFSFLFSLVSSFFPHPSSSLFSFFLPFLSFPLLSFLSLFLSIRKYLGVPGGSDGTASVYNAGDPGLGISPGEGNGSPLQVSSLENPMDGGAW